MNRRVLFSLLVTIIAIVVINIFVGSIFINQESYRNKAWNYIQDKDSVINWKEAKVDIVNLKPRSFIYQGEKKNAFYFSSRINRALLYLNGNNAIQVTFKRIKDPLLGTEVIYINPFTKGVIGFNFRY